MMAIICLSAPGGGEGLALPGFPSTEWDPYGEPWFWVAWPSHSSPGWIFCCLTAGRWLLGFLASATVFCLYLRQPQWTLLLLILRTTAVVLPAVRLYRSAQRAHERRPGGISRSSCGWHRRGYHYILPGCPHSPSPPFSTSIRSAARRCAAIMSRNQGRTTSLPEQFREAEVV